MQRTCELCVNGLEILIVTYFTCEKWCMKAIGVGSGTTLSESSLAGNNKMAGGIAVGGNNYAYNSESSWLAFLCCLSASAGGALFG